MAIKLRALVKHPSRLEGGTGIEVTKENGVFTAALDLDSFSEATAIADQAQTQVILLTPGATDADADVHERMDVDDFLGHAFSSGGTFPDNVLTIADNSDATKQFQFQASGITTATTRTLTVPDADTTLVGTDTTDTLENKSIDLADNTLTGTIAEFNTAVSDGNLVDDTRQVISGAGLTGGGNLSADRTLAVGAGTGIAVNADDVALAAIADDRVMANVSGGAAAPSANTLTAVIDACVGSTQGQILTRNSTVWTALSPGTSGHFLKSQGAGADLVYDAIPGGGDLLSTNNLSDVASAATAFGNIKQPATASATGVVKRQRIAIIRDEKTSGTDGGDFTSGADRIRNINFEASDLDGIVSVASNQFTLQAGTWLIQWSAPAYKVDQHQSFLYNVTDTAEVARGSSESTVNAGAYAQTRSMGSAIVTIAGAKAFEIRHRCTTTQAGNGLGRAGSFGTEVYTEVVIMSYDQ